MNLTFAPDTTISKLGLLSLLLVAGLQPLSAESLNRNDAALWRPRFATPAIVAIDSRANRQFSVEVKAAPTATGWSITISNDLRAWNCPVVSAVYSKLNRGT